MGASADPAAYERYGRYVLIERIGMGGMAEVFRAVSRGAAGVNRTFVIKRILRECSASSDFQSMFINEARICALLNHPNIVQTYEFGECEGHHFLSMEFLRGKELGAVLRKLALQRSYMAPALAAYIVEQVAEGLDYAHSLRLPGGKPLNIIHRDISPSNVMLLRSGGVKLLDFGVAKAALETQSQGTRDGVVKGKLCYLSPEQIQKKATDARVDIFALGVVLWEALTGRRLFRARNDYETLVNVQEREIPPPSTLRPEIPAALDQVALKALQRDPDRRYQRAGEMAEQIGAYLDEVSLGRNAVSKLLDELFGEDSREVDAELTGLADLFISDTAVPVEAAAPLAKPGIASILRSGKLAWGRWRGSGRDFRGWLRWGPVESRPGGAGPGRIVIEGSSPAGVGSVSSAAANTPLEADRPGVGSTAQGSTADTTRQGKTADSAGRPGHLPWARRVQKRVQRKHPRSSSTIRRRQRRRRRT